MAPSLTPARSLRGLSLVAAAMVTLVVVPSSVGQAARIATASDARRTVSALLIKVERATEDYDSAQVALSRSEHREKQLEGQVAAQRKTVNAFEAQVSAFAADAYRRGRMDLVSSLLQSGSPQMFLDELSTLDNLSRDQRSQLDQLIAAKRLLDKRKQQVDAELTAQRKTEQVLKARKASIEKDLATWRALVARADAQAAAAARAADARAAQLQAARASRASRTAQPVRTATPVRAIPAAHQTPAGGGGGYTGSASGSAAVALRTAYAQLGKPYQWGAAGPGSFDCSGLMMYSWAAAGVSLPHSSRAQYGSGSHVSRSALRPGDLVFFGSPIYHVGMYVGGGMMIHAPTPGDVVRIAPLLSDFAGATRP